MNLVDIYIEKVKPNALIITNFGGGKLFLGGRLIDNNQTIVMELGKAYTLLGMLGSKSLSFKEIYDPSIPSN